MGGHRKAWDMNIGERIREKRVQIGKTLLEMAEFLGVREATAQRYESGQIKNIKHESIIAIAEFLNTTPGYLMGWDDSEIPIDKSKWHPIPIYDGIAAGIPIFTEDNIVGYEYMETTAPQDHFLLVVHGDSMINAGIIDGSMVLIRRQPCAENGQIVACMVNGDSATLKRYRRQGDVVILQPDNPKYEPMILPTAEFDTGYAKILGVAEKMIVKL